MVKKLHRWDCLLDNCRIIMEPLFKYYNSLSTYMSIACFVILKAKRVFSMPQTRLKGFRSTQVSDIRNGTGTYIYLT